MPQTNRNNEQLRPGDVVVVLGGVATITSIRRYNGPLAEVFAIAETTRGAYSLCTGGSMQVVAVAS